MVKLVNSNVLILNGRELITDKNDFQATVSSRLGKDFSSSKARQGTITYKILSSHNKSESTDFLKLKFDSITSHDITYVGIIQTARASGMDKFPIPYVLTNCHNSLCAVGGTINEDDHKFALSAAQKYGGIYVPPNLAVIHSYNREMMAKCGGMILGSDSHTRYGALGTMGVGEGGGELVKQLLGQTYDMKYPQVIAIYLKGRPNPGVGPHDVALTIIKAVYNNNFVKNKVMEFIGEGVSSLPVEFRNGIDVMTTEAGCWSSIWETDDLVRDYYETHGRLGDYKKIKPEDMALYDGLVEVDLSKIKPSIALPFHPSNVYTIEELKESAKDIFADIEKNSREVFSSNDVHIDLMSKIRDGQIHFDQGIIVGCAGGTFDNIMAAADILRGKSIGNGNFSLSIYPGSQPTYLELVRNGAVADLMAAGALIKPAFCGPCFGAGDTPANNEFSIRHSTRNFPNREGSKPTEGQVSMVALMDARSIAATAANKGILTAADEIDISISNKKYFFDRSIYEKRVYNGWGKEDTTVELVYGPNIKDWPSMPSLTEHVLLKVITYINDPVTTTDEIIPSGETSSYRSNPQKLAEFTFSRKDPSYVRKAKEVLNYELLREKGTNPEEIEELKAIYDSIRKIEGFEGINVQEIGIGSTIYANKPGDGSAREYAASCQRILGAWANIAKEYATKRYRSNLINWGIIPFLIEDKSLIGQDDFIFIPNIKSSILNKNEQIKAYVLGEKIREITLSIGSLTDKDVEILVSGSLINYNKNNL
ncbi:hydratase [Tepidanaerobacter sp. GT38]|uniref:hydratase n=1 Tax=Tepidanaerobacter sp. GT38 TaxID=2722793 RepID=UPI001F48459F|nr:hydratase [Tepidanaerobacter sp. GT38]MCG1012464.1 hydratase [Tepidanaerobacter sp. GT38]